MNPPMLLELDRPPEERDLVARMRAGDRTALRPIVDRYQDRVARILHGLLGDVHDAEDAAQEVFWKVFARIDRYDGRAGFYAWLYRIAVNQAKDHLRRRGRRTMLPLRAAHHVPAQAACPLARAQGEEARRGVRSAVDALPPRLREALVLREFGGLSYKEIAATLGVGVAAVQTRLYRARRRLARTLARFEREAANTASTASSNTNAPTTTHSR